MKNAPAFLVLQILQQLALDPLQGIIDGLNYDVLKDSATDVAYPTFGSTATAWQLIDLRLDENGNPVVTPNAGGTGYDNGNLSEAQVKALQKALGVDVDGKYGPKSKEASGGLSATEAYKKYVLNATETKGYFDFSFEEYKDNIFYM